MDSRWYLFPGQTLENTKISDRVHALHITDTAWQGITKHLDRKKLIQEAIDKEEATKKYLDDGSKSMTKSWENSLENVRKRKEEERIRLIEQKKDDRMQRFLELRKEQEEIRRQYMEKVKKQIFMTTGHARDLTSALVTSEILYEREKQQEFQNKIKQHEKAEDIKFAELVKKDAEMEMVEKRQKQKELLEKGMTHGQVLKKIIEEKQIAEKTIKENRIRSEAIDNINAVKEIEKLEAIEIQEKLRYKKELFLEKQKHLKQQEEKKKQSIREEKELDEVVQIYKDAKHRIDCLKKDREKELRDMVLKRRDQVAKLVVAEQQNKSEAEERSIQKAMAERDAAELEKIKARAEFDEKMKQERLKNRTEVIQKEIEKKQRHDEIKKWEILNRYKTDENTKKYEEEKRKEMWNQILRYRNELLDQMEDNRMEQIREKQIEDAFMKSSFGDENRKFFEYANEVMELAKKKGRSTYPIERVITKYAKKNNIKTEKLNYKNETDGKLVDIQKKLVKSLKPRKCRCECLSKK